MKLNIQTLFRVVCFVSLFLLSTLCLLGAVGLGNLAMAFTGLAGYILVILEAVNA